MASTRALCFASRSSAASVEGTANATMENRGKSCEERLLV
jgi:hypothetical protein